MHLSSELLSKFSEAVLRIYTPTTPSEIPSLYMGAVRNLLDCEHLCYNEFGSDHFCGIVDPAIDPELNNRFALLANQHPSIRHVTKTGITEAVKISDFVNLRDWQRTDLFNEFFRKLGIHHQLALMFPVESIQIGFAANRGRRDFSESDRLLLSLLQPHLSQSYQNAKASERSKRAADAQGGGTIIFLSDGKILFCSPRARDAIKRFFGSIIQDRLPDKLYRWVSNGLQAKSADGLCSGALHPLTQKGEQSNITVRLSPNFCIGEHVLVIEEELQQQPISVFTQFGHSKREAEVLSWIAQGKSNPEIAIILNISPRTVAHHVEHILAKIGVEGRGGAAFWAQEMLRIQQARWVLSESGGQQ